MSNPNHMVMGVDFILGDQMKEPPPCPEGFERASDNEFVLLKRLPKCRARGQKETSKPCCGIQKHIVCRKIERIVTRKDCLVCESPSK